MKKLLITIALLLFTFTTAQAQDKNEKEEEKVELHVKVKDGAKPDIYVDGKKFDFEVSLLDPTKIASMNVVKGKEALENYNAPNGVILITTTKTKGEESTSFIIKDVKKNEATLSLKKTEIRLRDKNAKDPLIIIDGKEVTKVELKKLKPEQIDAIEVIKDKLAKEKYGSDSGVIIVKTKKEVKDVKKSKVGK